MDITPLVEFYDRITNSVHRDEIDELETEVRIAVLNKDITDEKDIMILNLALNLKSLHFLLKETLLEIRDYTESQVGWDMGGVDPEEAQLKEFHDREIDELTEGNVISINHIIKKKDD